MANTTHPAAWPPTAAAGTSAPPSDQRTGVGAPATAQPGDDAPQSARAGPGERLAALGVAEPTAQVLLDRYGRDRVVDALDAVDTLGDGEVRRRAGWVVSAIRQGWDLEELLAERRQIEARHARWERERDERDLRAERWRTSEAASAGWRAAVSAALDDRQLAVAVERVTSPVAGLDRRSVPIMRAELVAWAVAAHRAAPDRPLPEVLADDLVGSDRTVTAPSLEGPLPSAPAAVDGREDDLADRLTDLLARRPDLSHPGRPPRECARAARGRALVEGVGHER